MTSFFKVRHDEPVTGWFDEHADRWVERGLVSSDQVHAIREYEHLGAPLGAVPQPEPRLSLVAELAVYLGSVLALMSGAMMVGQSWDALGLGGRIAIGLAVAVLGFVAGTRLMRLDDPGTRRLASFMWLIGTGGVALSMAAIADRADIDQPAWNVLIVGIPVFAIGAALWRNLDRPLQVLTTAVGAGLALGATGALIEVTPWVGGIVVWSLGVAVAALAVTQRLRPELYVLAVAAITAMIGALMVTDLSEIAGSAFGTVTAAGIIAVGLARRRVPVLVIGVLAFLQTLQGLLLTTLSGPIAAMVVAALGITVVVVVVARSTRSTSNRPPGTSSGPTQATL